MQNLPAFEVRDRSGKSFKIWADGRIDGFPDDATIVFNRIPLLINEAVVREQKYIRDHHAA